MEITWITKEWYLTNEHITFLCNYHVIFCPKYRRNILVDWIDKRIKELFSGIAEKYNFDITDIEVMPDHIHLIISCNPRFWIMNCIHKLKWISSQKLRKEFPDLKKKLPTLWTRSSFIASIWKVDLETIKLYIANQKNV